MICKNNFDNNNIITIMCSLVIVWERNGIIIITLIFFGVLFEDLLIARYIEWVIAHPE